MNGAIITGYHTTHIKNVESILNNGFFISKPNAGHWLGKGVYFFDDIYYAEEWKIIGVAKKYNLKEEIGIEKSCIIIAKIDCEEFEKVDFSTPDGYEILKTLLELIRENYEEEEYEKILSRGSHYVIKVLEKLEIVKQEKNLSQFDIICADYYSNLNGEKNLVKNKSDFLTVVQKQICVKNIEAIKNIYKLEETNEHKKTLEMVKRNRRNIK